MAEADRDNQTVNQNAESLEVGGFIFKTPEDAAKARIDARKIDYLESHVKLGSIANMETVYSKSVQSNVFGTPLGWSFLSYLRRQIQLKGGQVESLPSIKLDHVYTRVTTPDDYIPREEKPKEPRRTIKGLPRYLLYSLIANVLLLIMVVGMFLIAGSNSSATVLNYREKIINEFAAWEQELDERERAVTIKERELGIEVTPHYGHGASSDDGSSK